MPCNHSFGNDSLSNQSCKDDSLSNQPFYVSERRCVKLWQSRDPFGIPF